MTRGDRERACSREEVLPGPGSGDRPTRTRRQRTAIPLGSLQAHGSRRAVPPASARIFGARLPRRAPLTLNPSPLSSDMFSFPCDSSWLPRHHFASFSSHRTRLVERIPRLSALVPKESVIAPFIWGSTGTQATRAHENRGSVWMGRLADDRGGGWGVGGSWTWKAGTGESSCGHTLGHHRVRGSVWVVVVVAAVFPETCAVALGVQRRLWEKNGSFPGSPQKDFEKSRGRDVIDLSNTLTSG